MRFNGVVVEVPGGRSSFASWLYVPIGIVLGTGAIVSALQIGSSTPIVAPLDGPLEVYRNATHPTAALLLGYLHQWFPSWQPPAYETDIYLLSFAGSFLGFGLFGQTPRVRGIVTFVASLVVTLAVGATFLGLVPWALIIEGGHSEDDWRERLRFVAFLSPVLFAGAFFLMNALN